MTKKIEVGNLYIGGGAPVTVQSMTNIDTRDTDGVTAQTMALAEAGCDIVRLTVPDMEAAESFGRVKTNLRQDGILVPLVADIHFDYRLAIAAIENGADKVRINPGNIGSAENVRKVVEKAKEYGVPIRVGVNAGSLEKDILEREGGITAKGLAESALRNVKILEDMDFGDIVISLKASDVRLTYEAYKLVAKVTDYPLHIGVTEAGTPERGRIKSAVGIGGLLLEGIGDTIRVSLTGDPLNEVKAGKEILEALGIRKTGIDIVSCPTCGRTKVDLEKIVQEVEMHLAPIEASRLANALPRLTIAVMGCVVNGPGEARSADLGVACGDGKGVIFTHGNVLRTVSEEEIAGELAKEAANFSQIPSRTD